jgi:hypothetical protein
LVAVEVEVEVEANKKLGGELVKLYYQQQEESGLSRDLLL